MTSLLLSSLVTLLLSISIRAAIKSFSGATTEDMDDYLKPLSCKEPDLLVLHVGTNDISSAQDSRSITEGIVNLAQQFQQDSPSSDVAISAILRRADKTDLNTKIDEANKIVRQFCRSYNWSFINHSNINERSLNRRGLHVNHQGMKLLTDNYTKILN